MIILLTIARIIGIMMAIKYLTVSRLYIVIIFVLVMCLIGCATKSELSKTNKELSNLKYSEELLSLDLEGSRQKLSELEKAGLGYSNEAQTIKKKIVYLERRLEKTTNRIKAIEVQVADNKKDIVIKGVEIDTSIFNINVIISNIYIEKTSV
jgi:septal ring factor EnvC (AmiA/AmiB activator)